MSNIIKGIRTVRGLTQEDVAVALDMTVRTYCRREANPDTFTLLELKKLALMFEIEVSNFFNNELTLTVSKSGL